MILFYATDIRDELIYFPEEEARHAVQVLRRQPGEAVTVVDGRGGWYEATLVEASKKHCVARIDRYVADYGRRPCQVHLAIAPTKNINRFEWFLEKATELGIDRITPLLCFHSERRNLRADRLEKILLAAMKQSLKAYLPQLDELTPFDRFIRREAEGERQRFIAYLGPRTKGHLKDNYRPGNDVTILIGPEGDFSEEEIDLALAHGYDGVSLGASRLRTETAGIAACHIANLLNE